MIEFPIPQDDSEKTPQKMITSCGLMFSPGKYGVGITNLDNATLEWKCTEFCMPILVFEKAIDKGAATEVSQWRI